MENKVKHLEMIQGIITRMGNNSFQLKGWSVTLTSLICALSTKESDRRFAILAFIPIVAFWAIDSFYLQLERKYRALYNQIRGKREDEVDYDMDISKIVVKDTASEYWRCFLSKTELFFYGSIILAVIVLGFVLKVL